MSQHFNDDSQSAKPFGAARGGASRPKVDYKERLSAEDFASFARLREWRKQVSQAEAVPVYTVFTNEQLAQMVQQPVTSKQSLEQIAGVGDARVEKYGSQILEILQQLSGISHAANGSVVEPGAQP